MNSSVAWPVLTQYDAEHLARVAMPLGGIGTGTVSLGGRGDLRDWEIMNRPAKGFTPANAFWALQTETADGTVQVRALEGPLDAGLYEGSSGSRAATHGLPRFRSCRFEAAYPLAQVHLSDKDAPLTARLQAWNPLLPGDVEQSGLPVAVLRWTLRNGGDEAVRATVCGSLQNFIGSDGTEREPSPRHNRNTFHDGETVSGVFLQSDGVDKNAASWGTIALSVVKDAALSGISHRTAWTQTSWGGGLLHFWDDLQDGQLNDVPRAENNDTPTASLAASVLVPSGGEASLTFLFTWHFPNRMSWTPEGHPAGHWLQAGACEIGPPVIGNYYTTKFADAWEAAQVIAPLLPELEQKTVQFVQDFCDSDLPDVVKEAALFNLSTLRTQTVFRTPDGNFFGWEGCHDKNGSCFGSCTHVWNYEQATAFLFGDMARNFRDIEFLHMTDPKTGAMPFRAPLPLTPPGNNWRTSAADGQMGCLMKLYRDWKLSGDDHWLRSLWPRARKALEFCWIEGGWDADRDGVMEGCQHNTMDVEYYGPNGQMGAWYLGALRACEEMARHLGESDFADECCRLFVSGSTWMDAHLFNNEYYPQHIVPPVSADAIAPGLRHSQGADNLSDPELQLGDGCLVDQLVGQYMAHLCGLGYLLQPENVQKTLQSIYTHNFKPDLWNHFNAMRGFALGDEAAVLMATYPHHNRPPRPFSYYSEVMTGFEYTAAVGMLQEGQTKEGLEIIHAIRARYDGAKRSPFNEAECGHHYARAMASWACVPTLTGFAWDGHTQAMTLAAFFEGRPYARHFWSNGQTWGTCRLTQSANDAAGGFDVTLSVSGGTLVLRRFVLTGAGDVSWETTQIVDANRPLVFRCEALEKK